MPGLDDVCFSVQKEVRDRHAAHRSHGMLLRMRERAIVASRAIAIVSCGTVLFLCAACLDSSAMAQQATVAAGPTTGQPGLPPDAAAPTATHVAKARKLILATGISRSFQIIIPEFMDQIGNTLTQSRPDLIHDMDLVLVQLKPEFEHQSDEMIDQSARIYATLLSETDIDAILAFFNSDAGKRYVGAQPFFLNQLVSGMQAWQQKISINMMARVREEMKKKGHDL